MDRPALLPGVVVESAEGRLSVTYEVVPQGREGLTCKVGNVYDHVAPFYRVLNTIDRY